MNPIDVLKYIENKLINDQNTLENNIRFASDESKICFYKGEAPQVPFCILTVIPHFENDNKFKIRLWNVPSNESHSLYITFIDGEPTWDMVNNLVN